MPSGPIPLSAGQYSQDAGGYSGLAAAQSATGLAGAIIGNPQQLAQARYLGAGTAQETAQAAAQQADNQAVASFQQQLSNPGNLTPGGISRMLATAAASPTLSARALQLIQGSYAAGAVGGAGGPAAGAPSVAQASNLGALTGITNYAQTPTGYQAGLNTDIQQSQISAGATLGAADISAKAAEADTAATIQGDNARTLVPVAGATPGAPPTYQTAVQAGANGAQYYDPAIAAQNNTPTNVLTPGGLRTVTTGAAEQGGLTPAQTTPAGVQATILQGATTPTLNQAPAAGGMGAVMSGAVQAPGSPTAQPPATGAPNSSLNPNENAAVTNNLLAQMTGQPAQGPVDPQAAAQMDQLISSRLEAGKPVALGADTRGSSVPSQSLMNPIRLQAAWLLTHDPNVRGNVQQAVTQAIANVTGATGGNYSQNLHVMPAILGGQPGPSQLVINDPTKIQWPQGMPVPPQYATQPQSQGMPQAFAPPGGAAAPAPAGAQPTGMPAAFAGAQQGTPPQAAPPAPAAPAQAAAPQGQQGQPTAQQIMGQAQDAINQITSSNDPPQVQQQKIQAIRQRLIQMGVLPNLPPGTPH
jgi:hypothetical protein